MSEDVGQKQDPLDYLVGRIQGSHMDSHTQVHDAQIAIRQQLRRLARYERGALLRSEISAPENAVCLVNSPGGAMWLCVEDDVDGPQAWYELAPLAFASNGDRAIINDVEGG